jgi:hypothetical protein
MKVQSGPEVEVPITGVAAWRSDDHDSEFRIAPLAPLYCAGKLRIERRNK